MDPLYRVPTGFEEEWLGSSATATEIVLNVIRLGEVFNSHANAVVRRYGVPSTTGLMLLEVLRGEGGPMQPSQIAERCFLSRPGVTAVVDALERRGLVTRERHNDDRRRTSLHLTALGRQTLQRVLPELHQAEAAWIDSGLSTAQQVRLLQQLARLSRGVNAAGIDAGSRQDV